MTRVSIVAPVHYYDDVRIFQKEAQTLQKEGYEIILYAQADCNKNESGIQIKRISKFNSRFKRFLLQVPLLLELLKNKSDIYHLHNPDMLMTGFILKFFRRKIVYDTHEDFSKRLLMREWIPAKFRKGLSLTVEKLEKTAARYFDACIVTQPHLVSKYGEKTILIENAPILESTIINNAYKISHEIEKQTKIIRLIYAGSISNTRGIKELILAVDNVNKEVSCRLWLIGKFSDSNFYSELESMEGWKYVDYLGYLPQEEVFAHMITSDIGMVTILDVGDHSTTSANKLYEYQRFGLPFISSSFDKWMNEVEKTNSGLFVNPLDITEISKSIIKLSYDKNLREKMGENGQNYITKNFNWNLESEKLIKLYKKIT